MKYLSHYTDKKTSALFDKYGAFFSFSKEQFDDAKKDGVQYESAGGGLIAPVGTTKDLLKDLDAVVTEARKEDIKENGIKAIIHREFGNYETQISMDQSDAIAALEPYGLTKDQIMAEWPAYWQHCIDNDYF